MRRLWHSPLVVLFLAIALHLQGCDDEDSDDNEEKEEKVKPEVVSQGNATEEATEEHVWSGEHHRSTYGGPPAKLGHFDERQKKVQPDVLPGKGGKLLEAERSFERALLANSGAEQQVRNLEKEKHLEDYYKQNPTTTSTTSSSTEALTAEDDEGGHGEDENTVAKGDEGGGKAVPEEGEDSNEEAAKTTNATTANATNATNATNTAVEPPEAAEKVGAGTSSPSGSAEEELQIEHGSSLAPSATKAHDALKPIDQAESAGGSKEKDGEGSQKPDQASSLPDEKEAKDGGKIDRAEAAEAAVATNVNDAANEGKPKEPKQTAGDEEQPEHQETPPEPSKNTAETNQIEEPQPTNEEHDTNEETKETGQTKPQEEETIAEPAKNTAETNQIEESKPSNEEHDMNEEQSQEESDNAGKAPANPPIHEEAGEVENAGEKTGGSEGSSPEMEAGKVPTNSENNPEAGQGGATELEDGHPEDDAVDDLPEENKDHSDLSEDSVGTDGTKPALIEMESHQAQRNSQLHRQRETLLELQLKQDEQLEDFRAKLARQQDWMLQKFRQQQHQELELQRHRIDAGSHGPAMREMDQKHHGRNKLGSRKMGQWLQELADAEG